MNLGKFIVWLKPKYQNFFESDEEPKRCQSCDIHGYKCSRPDGHTGEHEAHARPLVAVARWGKK